MVDFDAEVLDGVFYNQELVRVGGKNHSHIDSIVQSKKRGSKLWHQVQLKSGKLTWMKNEALI